MTSSTGAVATPDIGLDSYDRLFRNQDTLPHGGFGNLIALPLQRAARKQDNTVFVDGAFVPWPDQWSVRVSLPTDQIVVADDTGGFARVGFGGMSFAGIEEGRLIFLRVRDLQPEEQLSPARSHKMKLEPHMVSSILVNGRPVWPAESLSSEAHVAKQC